MRKKERIIGLTLIEVPGQTDPILVVTETDYNLSPLHKKNKDLRTINNAILFLGISKSGNYYKQHYIPTRLQPSILAQQKNIGLINTKSWYDNRNKDRIEFYQNGQPFKPTFVLG